MSGFDLAPRPLLERPMFDLLGVMWKHDRCMVQRRMKDWHINPILQFIIGPSIRLGYDTYFIEFATPHGPVFVEVSGRRWGLTQNGDVVPIKYRIGRRSGWLQGQLNF